MAKTFRKRGYVPTWVLRKLRYEDGKLCEIHYERERARARVLAKFHSDAGVGPGYMKDEPRWWRNLFERKDRRFTTRELYRFMQDQEHEVQLHKKPPMSYWW